MPRTYGTTNVSPSATAPAVGIAGDIYWDTTNKVLYVSDGTAWQPTISSVIPLSTLGPATAQMNAGGYIIANLGGATGGLHAMNRNSSDARYPQLATLTTKGDMYAATAAGTVARLPVSASNGQCLVSDSTQTTGMAFQSREVVYTTSTGNVSFAGAAVRIVGVNSVPYKAGRKYKISAEWRQMQCTVANDIVALFLAHGAAPASGIGAEQLYKITDTAFGQCGGSIWVRYTPGSDITQDTWLYGVRAAGTGTTTVQNNSTAGCMQFLVEDIT